MKKKMLTTIASSIIMIFVLSGSSCTRPNHQPTDKVQIDPSLLVRCPELPQVDPKNLPMGELFLEYSKLQGQYIECAIRNDCLIEATADGHKVTCPALDKLKDSEQKKSK